MIRKLLTILGGAAAAGAMLTTPASAAQTDTAYRVQSDAPVEVRAWGDCPGGRMCIFGNLNGGRPYAVFATGDGDLADSSGPRGMNNTTESVWNRTGRDWCFYDAGGFNNLIFVVGPGFQGDLLPEHRNKVTSLRACP